MKRKLAIYLTVLFVVVNPLDSQAGIFSIISNIFGSATSSVTTFLNMSYLVKEYAAEQASVMKLLPKAQTVLAKNAVWLTEEEYKMLNKMRKNINSDIERCEKADAEYLKTLVNIKIDLGGGLNSGDMANINEYINNAWARLKKYRFQIESFTTYVECVVQNKKVLLRQIKYDSYRQAALNDLNDLYKKKN